MATTPVNGSGGTGATGATTPTAKKKELGQDAFLQLMVAQMKNQDPTKPADPTEFLGQLAQFSTVSGIEGMRDSMTSLSDSLRSSQVLGGTSMVGHAILAVGDEAMLGPEGKVFGATTVPAGASEATVIVKDASGQQVARIPIATTEGEVDFTWDGNTGLGDRAPPGKYTFTAVANVGGASQQLQTQIASMVNSVSIDPTSNQLTLNTDIGPIALAAVRQVM
jgi:flagellar basal-body rod modification protein FlgD